MRKYATLNLLRLKHAKHKDLLRRGSDQLHRIATAIKQLEEELLVEL